MFKETIICRSFKSIIASIIIPILEGEINKRLARISYIDVLEFWRNIVLDEDDEDGFDTKVQRRNIHVNSDLLRAVFGFGPTNGAPTNPESMNLPRLEFVEMIKTNKAIPSSLSINVKHIALEYNLLSKIIAKNIVGFSGSLDTLSGPKIDLMIIICRSMKFDWAGNFMQYFQKVFVEDRDGIKRTKTKPLGLMVQAILNNLQVPETAAEKINKSRYKPEVLGVIPGLDDVESDEAADADDDDDNDAENDEAADDDNDDDGADAGGEQITQQYEPATPKKVEKKKKK